MDKFIALLIEKKLLSKESLSNLKKESEELDVSLEELIIERKGIEEKILTEIKAEALGVPVKFLEGRLPVDVLRMISEESARLYKFIPLGIQDGLLEIGMLDPLNIGDLDAVQFIASKLNLPFKAYLISLSDFRKAMEEYKALGVEVTKSLSELETALEEKEIFGQVKTLEEEVLTEEAPVIKMMAVILKHAIEGRASDIHIEPSREKLRVRFRVDGILYTSLYLPMKVHEAMVGRVKILTNLQLDEKRKPQDGRFSTRIAGRDIDFRVSTFPTYFGEKVAIRILDPQRGVLDLSSLGLEGRNLEIIKEGLKKPYGMILLTGPTGSGKTTTLYAMLQLINQERFNLVSLEDPVEYSVAGVNQSQVMPEIGYEFANGLRSILRQDPDIIMVGEIRDSETAKLAVHAALTGHLVLSTLHTNNAISSIPRLIDMGVEPYLIPPTVIMVIGQRLVPTLCLDSRKKIEVKGAIKEKLEQELKDFPEELKKDFKIPEEIYQTLPSPVCPKGTKGRIGVFEVLKMTPELERLILTKPAQEAIFSEARRQGMITMREDGILKVLQGKISLEELAEIV